ncbi:MAG: hypothetical protein LBD80_07835 [Tannerella sp.]|jgi:hypothetical protein|nr:hypothetical protein [Tannerella sp.]
MKYPVPKSGIWKDGDWQIAEQHVATDHFLNLKNVTTNKTDAWFTVYENEKRSWL